MKKNSSGAAREAALVRGMNRTGISREKAQAYEAYGMKACGVQGGYRFKQLSAYLQDKQGRTRFFEALAKHQDQEMVAFFTAYLGWDYDQAKLAAAVDDEEGQKPDAGLLDEPKEDIDWDTLDDLDDIISESLQHLEGLEVDWDLFNPAKSCSIAELTELVGAGGMAVDTDLDLTPEDHDGELYVIESHVNKMKIKHHNIEAPYVEIPGAPYDQLKEDFELAPHLKAMEEVIETLTQKGRAMMVVQNKFTAFTALRYVAEVFSCQGEYCGDADADDLFEQAYSLQNKLLVVSAEELDKCAGGVQFQDLNSGVLQHQLIFPTMNLNPPWELFQDIPLAIIMDRHDNLSSGFSDQVEDIMKNHKPVVVVFVKNNLFAEELNMDNFMNTMTNNRDLIADDISFSLDFDVFEIDEPETGGEYYQAVARTVASLLGHQLDKDLDLPELLTKLRQIRKHRWAGNTTIRQAISKAVSLKEVDDGVLRRSDFDYLNKSLVNQRMKVETQAVKDRDAVEIMNRELIGLDPVKEQIMTAVNALEMRKRRQASGLKSAPLHNTFVFQGPPGTGKTEMARHLTAILAQKNLIDSEHGEIAFISGSDLRGEYVGQTNKKVQKLFEEHSALFIDEAYGIVSAHNGSTDSYSQEALAELCIQLERHSTSKLVIFAGYDSSDQGGNSRANMKTFLEENPGINSRISHVISFPSYQPEELLPILKCMAEKNDYTLEKGYRNIALDLFKKRSKSKNFASGREVRRFFEMAVSHQAARLNRQYTGDEDISVEAMKTIALEDLKAAAETVLSAQKGLEEKQAKTVGFVM